MCDADHACYNEGNSTEPLQTPVTSATLLRLRDTVQQQLDLE
jgi:hypothetical protein